MIFVESTELDAAKRIINRVTGFIPEFGLEKWRSEKGTKAIKKVEKGSGSYSDSSPDPESNGVLLLNLVCSNIDWADARHVQLGGSIPSYVPEFIRANLKLEWLKLIAISFGKCYGYN
jgi:hypothetical protein